MLFICYQRKIVSMSTTILKIDVFDEMLVSDTPNNRVNDYPWRDT